MTPTEVLERFTEEELYHLWAYSEINGPWGKAYDNINQAYTILQTLAPHLKKGSKPKIKDYMITWDGSGKSKSPDELLAQAKQIQSTFEVNSIKRDIHAKKKEADRKLREAKKLKERQANGSSSRPSDSSGAGSIGPRQRPKRR